MEMIERPPRTRRKFLSRIALACVALASLAAFGVDKEELDCEQAVAHLVKCCPDFDARSIVCERSGGCGGGAASRVDLDLLRSECILGASCDDLVASGACEQPKKVVCE
jgi:hypothetical protein